VRTLTRFVTQIVVNAIALLAAALVVPGIEFHGGPADLILLGIIFGLVNALVKPLVKALTLPLNAATLGLFNLVVTALMFFLTALLSPAYHVDGLIPGVIGTVIVGVLSTLINHFVRD
jgi:putative membrane protein